MQTHNYQFSHKRIWQIAYPIILGSLAQDIITIADTIFAGRLGEVELGAIALGGIFYLAIVMLGFGFGIGLQVLIARRFGENNIDKVSHLLQHGLIALLGIALVLFLILKPNISPLISRIVKSSLLHDHTISFLNIRLWGLFAAYLNIAFRSFFIGISNTKFISYTTILMALVNITFDYLLMFGIGIFPALGLKGAAYASVIAEFIALISFILILFYSTEFEKYLFKPLKNIRLSSFQNIFSISAPTMLQNFISFGAWFIFFIFVEKMGTTELAISNIIRSLYIIVLLPIMGFASATNTLTSQAIGAGKLDDISYIIKRSITLCLSGMIIIASISLAFPKKIISAFSNNSELINATTPVLYVVTIASFFLAIGFILFNAVTGTGNTKTSLGIEIITIALYLIGVSLIVNAELKIEHVWLMEIFYGCCLAAISLLYIRSGKWKGKKI